MANNKKKTLNKGLEEIFGGDIASVMNEINNINSSASTAEEISVDSIKTNPYQPRKYFDKEKISELSESIKVNGIIQPLVLKEYKSGMYYVIAGERRLKASIEAGLSTVPAIIKDLNEKQMQDIAIIENIQRENLNPLEEAISYQKLMDDQGITQTELASKISKSRSYVANVVRMLKLPQQVADMVFENKLTMGQVKPLISLDNNEAIEAANTILKNNLNARDAEKLAKSYQQGKSTSISAPAESDPFLKEVEEKLSRKLGTKVQIKGKKIVIEFSNDEDLNEIVQDILN